MTSTLQFVDDQSPTATLVNHFVKELNELDHGEDTQVFHQRVEVILLVRSIVAVHVLHNAQEWETLQSWVDRLGLEIRFDGAHVVSSKITMDQYMVAVDVSMFQLLQKSVDVDSEKSKQYIFCAQHDRGTVPTVSIKVSDVILLESGFRTRSILENELNSIEQDPIFLNIRRALASGGEIQENGASIVITSVSVGFKEKATVRLVMTKVLSRVEPTRYDVGLLRLAAQFYDKWMPLTPLNEIVVHGKSVQDEDAHQYLIDTVGLTGSRIVSTKTCWPAFLLERYGFLQGTVDRSYTYHNLEKRVNYRMEPYCSIYQSCLFDEPEADGLPDWMQSPWPVPTFLDARWIYRHYQDSQGDLCTLFKIRCRSDEERLWNFLQREHTKKYLDRYGVEHKSVDLIPEAPALQSLVSFQPWFRGLDDDQKKTADLLAKVRLRKRDETQSPVLAIEKKKQGSGSYAQYFLVYGAKVHSQWTRLPSAVGTRFRLCLSLNRRLADMDPENIIDQPSPDSLDHFPMACQRIMMAVGGDMGRAIVPALYRSLLLNPSGFNCTFQMVQHMEGGSMSIGNGKTKDTLASCCAQVLFLSTVMSRLGFRHNDLHTGNVIREPHALGTETFSIEIQDGTFLIVRTRCNFRYYLIDLDRCSSSPYMKAKDDPQRTASYYDSLDLAFPKQAAKWEPELIRDVVPEQEHYPTSCMLMFEKGYIFYQSMVRFEDDIRSFTKNQSDRLETNLYDPRTMLDVAASYGMFISMLANEYRKDKSKMALLSAILYSMFKCTDSDSAIVQSFTLLSLFDPESVTMKRADRPEKDSVIVYKNLYDRCNLAREASKTPHLWLW